MNPRTLSRTATLLLASAALTFAACDGGDRAAEVKTPTGEAEVSTNLPETEVPDEQLEAAAANAAVAVSRPGANAVLPEGVDPDNTLIELDD